MWNEIEERVRQNGEYIAETCCTVRACAAHFGMSKSTVHIEVTLPNVFCGLFNKTIKTRQNQAFCFVFSL